MEGVANDDTTEMNLVEFETAMKRVCDFCKVLCVQMNGDVVFETRGGGGKGKFHANDGSVRVGGEHGGGGGGGGGDGKGKSDETGLNEEVQDHKVMGDAAVQLARDKLKAGDFNGAHAARDDAANFYALSGQDTRVGNAAIAEVQAFVLFRAGTCHCAGWSIFFD